MAQVNDFQALVNMIDDNSKEVRLLPDVTSVQMAGKRGGTITFGMPADTYNLVSTDIMSRTDGKGKYIMVALIIGREEFNKYLENLKQKP